MVQKYGMIIENGSQRKQDMEKEELKQDDSEYKEREQDDSKVLETALAAGHILLENGAEIARVEETMERICRHFGVESGNKVPDKFARSGLTASRAETVDAPVINELPLCLECEFIEYQSNEYGCGVIGRVVNVTADERVMVNGKPDMSLVNAIAFDPYTHGYYKVTERVGEAFKDGLKLKE